jgi:hypothetical protein
MDSSSFVSPNIILSDVLPLCGDTTGFKRGITKGFYISQIQQAVEELAIDSFFSTPSPTDLDMPTDLIVEIPDNLFNIKELYIWNGACCTPQSSKKVWYKRQMNNHPGGTSFTATRQVNQPSDPFLNPNNYRVTDTTNLYTANIENGYIRLSSNCSGFEKIRIIANSFGGKIEDQPLIPRLARQAVKDWVRVQVLTVIVGKERQQTDVALLALAQKSLDGNGRAIRGTWRDAVIRLGKMNTKAREDYQEYYSFIRS